MTALAWPTSFLVALIVFFLVFRTQISHFIDRVQKISKQGVDTTAVTVSPQTVEHAGKNSAADELLKAFDSRLLLEQEALIRTELDQKKVQDPAERERVLTRFLAAVYIAQLFENAYRHIWGSQLFALQQLNETEPLGLARTTVEAWYEYGRVTEPEFYANYSFDQWFGFMERTTLVVNNAGNVRITIFGNEFLKWLVQNSYAFTKRG